MSIGNDSVQGDNLQAKTRSLSNETQHTPGPWKIENNVYGEIVITRPLKVGGTGAICKLFYIDDDRTKANAALIASAPDLLKENKQLKIKLGAADQEIDYLRKDNIPAILKENRELKAKCSFQSVIDRHNVKRVIDLQFALRKIIQQWDDYSESVDEIPNTWFTQSATIAENALEESTKVDADEVRKQVKEALKERDELK